MIFGGTKMSIEQNKALIRKIFEESESRSEFPIELCTADFIVYQPGYPPMDSHGMNRHAIDIHTAFPDVTYTVKHVIAEGDMVAVRFIIQGTHTGILEGLPIPPSGKKVSVVNHAFGRIEDGKLAEWWTSPDTMGMMRQLGAIPS
jgi:predicted ester cyclase